MSKMDLSEAIYKRRSHRKFTCQKIVPADFHEALEAGLMAPSPKNRQPWFFVVCGPVYKKLIVKILKAKIDEMRRKSTKTGSLPISMVSIEECSELLLVYNQYAVREADYNKNRWKADILSIGACIQNMLLTAHSKNIQTLWIGDILFAEVEINSLLGTKGELVGAVAFGNGTRKIIPERPRTKLESKMLQTE